VTNRRFLDVELPPYFAIDVPDDSGGWETHGTYPRHLFDRLEDGTYVCSGHGGSPLFLRVIHQDGDLLTVLDGMGDEYLYKIVALPPP